MFSSLTKGESSACSTPEQAGPDPEYPPQSCVDAQNRRGHVPAAQNNGHRMSWTDVDNDPRTFNSSPPRSPSPTRPRSPTPNWAGPAARPATTPQNRPASPRARSPSTARASALTGSSSTAISPTPKPGTKSAKLAFKRTEDAYLVQNIAWSFPLPELTLAVDPEHPTAYQKATVTQTATVTNAGDAPAANVSVCGQKIGTIPPRAKATRACTTQAADDYQTTVTANGISEAGDPLAAQKTARVDVLHPALRATTATQPMTALPGQKVKFSTTVTNTGDTPLFDLTRAQQLTAATPCKASSTPAPPPPWTAQRRRATNPARSRRPSPPPTSSARRWKPAPRCRSR
ncbi:hypothetical protein C8D87_101938 [Lentzea atacamensis]|uniref:DUF11 domain-containing protein n=1 Tax=Lentzea atacamensis TaxID=531938 RepID=A0ABX9EHH9_9PSEU|nr:hypothetical protein C8D87_101938 [Lentzea atacamensis]